MLQIYQWLLSKIPKYLANIIMGCLYTAIILLILALSTKPSPEFIYWDQ